MKTKILKILKNKLLINISDLLDVIYTNIEIDVKDKNINESIMVTLSKLDSYNYKVSESGITIIENEGTKKEEKYELVFVPNIRDYNQITLKSCRGDSTVERTIEFGENFTTINEHGTNNYGAVTERKVYRDDELVYSMLENKCIIGSEDGVDLYKCYYYENYIDGTTLKTRISECDRWKCEDAFVERFYGKKTLKKPVPLDNRKEKIIYSTHQSGIEKCDEDEFDRFMEYWKEINTEIKLEDRILSKKLEANSE